MSSALMNRMIHVQLKPATKDWLEWAYLNQIHHWILEYIQQRPDHLWVQPPKTEEPFSSPRSWHMLSDGLHEFGEDISETMLQAITSGCLSSSHAGQFMAFVKQIKNQYAISAILKGEIGWPDKPEDRDLLYFLAQSFRAHLIREFPDNKRELSSKDKDLAHQAKALLVQLARINFEIAQLVVSDEDSRGEQLPNWFLVDVARDLPRIVTKQDG